MVFPVVAQEPGRAASKRHSIPFKFELEAHDQKKQFGRPKDVPADGIPAAR
jgi:hypothetical protein